MTPAELIHRSSLADTFSVDAMVEAERIADEVLLEASGVLPRRHGSEGHGVIVADAVRRLIEWNGPEFEKTDKSIKEISTALEEGTATPSSWTTTPWWTWPADSSTARRTRRCSSALPSVDGSEAPDEGRWTVTNDPRGPKPPMDSDDRLCEFHPDQSGPTMAVVGPARSRIED
jgi:hypothetical protein